MNCNYCGDPTERQIEIEGGSVPVCPKCNVLLSSPRTGPRLIRGHMSMRLRGHMNHFQLARLLDTAMPVLESMKKKDPA